MTRDELLSKYDKGERNFSGAHLSYADLHGANLGYANLCYANLRDADLRDANLGYAHLSYADLHGANLRGANLCYANLPPPTMILLARWGDVDANLCAQLMRYDASNHPEPKLFKKWAIDGPCPYNNCKWQRAANFKENRDLYRAGKPLTALQLAQKLLKRYCHV